MLRKSCEWDQFYLVQEKVKLKYGSREEEERPQCGLGLYEFPVVERPKHDAE